MSAKIAERYQRPLSSIAVHVQHSACIFFAGTFEPAYILTLSALGQYVQPSTNQRNAFLLSEHLEEALGVPPPRGMIRFVTMLDENVALNGKTLAQSLDEEANGKGSMGVIDEDQPASFARLKRLSVKVGKIPLCTEGFCTADLVIVSFEYQGVALGRRDHPSHERRGDHAREAQARKSQGSQTQEELCGGLVRKARQQEGEREAGTRLAWRIDNQRPHLA